MADVVMRKEDSDTLSVKELGAFLPPPPPPYPSAHSFYPPPFEPYGPFVPYVPYPPTVSPRPGPTTSVDRRGRWSKVVIRWPSTPQVELKRNWKKLLDDDLKGSVDDVPCPDKPCPVMSSPDIFECLPPSHIGYRKIFVPPFTPCPPYSPPAPGGYNYYRHLDPKPLLFAEIALHCYNFEKGTHFERLGLPPQSYDQTVEARDPVRNYTCKFETNVQLATENKACFHVIATRCRPLPSPPPGEDGLFQCGFDTLSVDELFKGNMPDWVPGDYATSTLLMQYYVMKESEVEQAKEWLHLYAELALFSKMPYFPDTFYDSKPLELGKVIVQTRGVVDSMKLDNAVFFITFKTSGGDVCKGIIRRTRDGIPEHLSLEAKCFM